MKDLIQLLCFYFDSIRHKITYHRVLPSLCFSTFLCVASLFVHAYAPAIELPRSITEDGKSLTTDSEMPWRIFADELVSLNDGIILEAKKNVLLVRGDDYLKADYARLYTSTQWILLQGNVVAKLGQDEMKATEAEFDLNNSTGWVRDAKVFMAGPNMYFSSTELHKQSENDYKLDDAVVTTCDGSSPLWSIRAKSAQVETDGYATFTNPTFQIQKQKVFYSPYLIVPTKTTRQTGLLLPDVGVSSEQGVFYTQPWFYAIDQSRDLTLYATIFSEKGFMPAIEYRSHTAERNKLWSAFDFLYDNDTVTFDASDNVDSSDGKVRDNHLRYWARAMGEGNFFDSDWQYVFNLDYVSDQNFLREFQNRMTGFDNSRVASFDMFGRDFAEVDQNRVSEGYIYRDWERLSLYGGFRYEQDPSLGNGNSLFSSDTTVQHLPELYAFWNKGKIIEQLPFEINGYFRSGYMYRRQGTSGLRTEVYPELSLPVDLRFASLELTAGARATLYSSTSENNNSPLTPNRERAQQDGDGSIVPEFTASLYTQATKTWEWPQELELTAANVGKKNYTGMRHVIQPRISYTWVDNVDQEDNPFYTLDDRIQDHNSVLFSLDNRFTLRNETVEKNKDSFELRKNYFDFLRLKLSTGYDFREANRERYTDILENRPWHDLRMRAEVAASSWLSFNGDIYYSFYENNLSRVDAGLALTHSRYGSFTSTYSLRDRTYNYREIINFDNPADIIATEPLDVITNAIDFRPTPKFQIYALETTNLETGKSYERSIGLGFLHQCVRIYGEYTKNTQEETVSLNIEFLGLAF